MMDAAATFEILPPAWYTHYLLEDPWPLAILLAAIACISISTGIMRGLPVKRWGLIAAISAFLAVAAAATAQLITTQAERLTHGTTLLVESAVTGNTADLKPLLADDFEVYVGHTNVRWGSEGFLARIPSVPQLVRSNHVREIRAAVMTPGAIGVTVFDQTTQPAIGGQPTPNRWRCIWTAQPDGSWKLSQLRWETWGLGQAPPIGILSSFSKSSGG